jgi:hypothetical protein
MSHHNPTSESLKAFLAARERVEAFLAARERVEAFLAARERVEEDRKRLAALEEALGVFLHIRDQVDDLEETEAFARDRDYGTSFRSFQKILALEALGRRELDVIETLRDLMVTA